MDPPYACHRPPNLTLHTSLPLHTPHFTPHTSPPLHTPHSTPHTSHPTLHTPHLTLSHTFISHYTVAFVKFCFTIKLIPHHGPLSHLRSPCTHITPPLSHLSELARHHPGGVTRSLLSGQCCHGCNSPSLSTPGRVQGKLLCEARPARGSREQCNTHKHRHTPTVHSHAHTHT